MAQVTPNNEVTNLECTPLPDNRRHFSSYDVLPSIVHVSSGFYDCNGVYVVGRLSDYARVVHLSCAAGRLSDYARGVHLSCAAGRLADYA